MAFEWQDYSTYRNAKLYMFAPSPNATPLQGHMDTPSAVWPPRELAAFRVVSGPSKAFSSALRATKGLPDDMEDPHVAP